MRCFLFPLVLLLLQFGICSGEQSKLQDDYLTTYLLLNYSGRIEQQGYTGLACTMYSDCLQRLIELHQKADLEEKEYQTKVAALRTKISDLRVKLGDSESPPPIDLAYKEFLRLALTADQSRKVNVNRDLGNWTKFHDAYPLWQPQLISKFIHDDEETLKRVGAGRHSEIQQ